ncbi:MAG TPA: OmpH family outer membrane protein [Methylomirabilota bacterium]|jgi:outer membrane protein|nr:OmpH family outer membrane protein [Methylomirabilota bacterium]
MKRFTVSLVMAIALTSTGVALAQAPSQPQPSAAPAGTRIGYIDVQRVLARSAAGVAAREALEREKAAMQKEMDGKRTELEKLRDELEKKGALMTADARRDKQDVFERKRRDAARLADDFGKELEKKEAELLQRVLREVGGIIERVGRERGYYLILERGRGSVLYASTDADITDEIIRAYDQQSGTKGAPATPPKKP